MVGGLFSPHDPRRPVCFFFTPRLLFCPFLLCERFFFLSFFLTGIPPLQPRFRENSLCDFDPRFLFTNVFLHQVHSSVPALHSPLLLAQQCSPHLVPPVPVFPTPSPALPQPEILVPPFLPFFFRLVPLDPSQSRRFFSSWPF